MSRAPWFILPLLSSITDFFTFWQARTASPAKPSSHLSCLVWGWSHSLLFCLWTFWVSSDAPSKDQGPDGSGGGRCPVQGIQSPFRANVSWSAPGCQSNSLTREQKSGQQSTNLSLEQLVWPFLRMPKKQQDIGCKTFTHLFEQPVLFNDLKSPVPSVLSPSSIMFKPKWLFHHVRVTLCLTAVS